MLDLMTTASDGWGFLVDRDNQRNAVATFAVRLENLPQGYLPDATAFHDESLRPDWETIPQNFLINTNWDAKLLAFIEKQYLGVSAFAHFTEIGKDRKLPPNVLRYNYDGGFSIMHLYNGIRSEVPQAKRARSVGVQAASPGVLTIDAPSSIVGLIKNSIEGLINSKPAYDQLHAWSRLSPNRIDGMPANDEALRDIQTLATSLRIDHMSLFPAPSVEYPTPTNRKESLLVAGKMIASYYRKLWQTLAPEPRVEFISIQINTTNVIVPPEVYDDEDGE
jgi:hypothetical protein